MPLDSLQKLDSVAQETQAFHYHLESYRYWPVDMNVITWLGIYYVKQEMYEAAIPFFSRASQIEPNEVKWRLMVASCYRRHPEHLSHIDLKPGMGAYPAALKLYEDIHRSHPNDIECVRYLITICKEMKQKYDHYAAHLRKLLACCFPIGPIAFHRFHALPASKATEVRTNARGPNRRWTAYEYSASSRNAGLDSVTSRGVSRGERRRSRL